MTNHEAIKILKVQMHVSADMQNDLLTEALQMAIKSLEQQDVTDSDTISRKQAIDAVENIDCSDGVGISALKCEAVDDGVTAIKALPSAQPEKVDTPTVDTPNCDDTISRPTGYWMRMSDLNELEDDRYKCSCCGNVVHHRDKVSLYTYNSWCGACGANMNAKNYVAYIQ